jgi:two-component system chemotaxis response regulator CheY
MSKLLLIDDSKLDQLIMSKLLRRYNLFPDQEIYLDAESAIKSLENMQTSEKALPDIIFLDLVMPHFDGFKFLERFRQLASRISKKIDVFIVTSSINPHDRLETENFEFVKGFLVKPVRVDALVAIARHYNASQTAA